MSAPADPKTGESPQQLREDLCEVAYREPVGDLAATVVDVVAEVFGVDRVGLDDSFYDFGGTSLQAISMCVRLEKITGRAVAPADILEHDVLADMVALLSGGPGAAVAEPPLDGALVHEAVARHARAAPESIALVHQDASFAYATLDAAADGCATRLAEHGVVPGIVPVLQPRSPELVAVQLAVLRLGASYTSLDPRWPVARLREVLGVLGDPPIVVSDRPLPFAPTTAVWSSPGDLRRTAADGTCRTPLHRPSSEAPAVVVFTSGSTGRPKGVVLPHRAITRMFRDGGPVGFGHGNVMPQSAPPWWDMYAYELFGQLMTGGTSVLTDGDYSLPQTLRHMISQQGANRVPRDQGLDACHSCRRRPARPRAPAAGVGKRTAEDGREHHMPEDGPDHSCRGGVAAGSRQGRQVVGVGEQIDVFDAPLQPARTSRPRRHRCLSARCRTYPAPSLTGLGRRAMNLRNDCGPGHGPVLVHRNPLAGTHVRPVGRGEGHEANRRLPAGLQNGHVLHPERGDADRTFTGGRKIPDVPHRAQNTGAGDRCSASALASRVERQLCSDHTVTDLGAPPMAPGRAPLHPELFSRFGELLPKRRWNRAAVSEFLQQAQGDLPLVVGEVVPDVLHRDVVLGGGLRRDQQGG